jgi:uncharacterized protein
LNNPLILIAVGLVTGIYSGIMGLGGGTIMIPMMVLMLNFSQHQAVATSLAAMLPPVTLFAVLHNYREGYVDIRTAGLIALGIAVGAYLGAQLAGLMSERALRLIFGFVLVYIGGYTTFNTLFGREFMARSMIFAGGLLAVAVLAYILAQYLHEPVR